MKTETEKIRELLDEYGVQYFKRDAGSSCFTAWGKESVNRVTFFEGGIGTLVHWTDFTAKNVTAEQVTTMIFMDDVQ